MCIRLKKVRCITPKYVKVNQKMHTFPLSGFVVRLTMYAKYDNVLLGCNKFVTYVNKVVTDLFGGVI